jgi:hypothetical protein
MWLQHDSAAPHYARNVKNFLNLTYPRRWIGRGGHVAWPPRSPDLTSPDFFMGSSKKYCLPDHTCHTKGSKGAHQTSVQKYTKKRCEKNSRCFQKTFATMYPAEWRYIWTIIVSLNHTYAHAHAMHARARAYTQVRDKGTYFNQALRKGVNPTVRPPRGTPWVILTSAVLKFWRLITQEDIH